MYKFLLISLSIMTALASLTLDASAATIRNLAEQNEFGCGIVLTGPIQANDAEIARPILSSLFETNPIGEGRWGDTLCLDSPGGNLAEALQIATYVRDYNVSVVIPPNARCESACSIVFLSSRTERTLYPNSIIGLHAPELLLPDGSFTRSQVLEAYDLSTETIRQILDIGTVPQAAVRYITSTPTSQMYYPRTFLEFYELELAGSLGNVGIPNVSLEEMIHNICRWATLELMENYELMNPSQRPVRQGEVQRIAPSEYSPGEIIDVYGIASVYAGEEAWLDCEANITLSTMSNSAHISANLFERNYGFGSFALHSPNSDYLESQSSWLEFDDFFNTLSRATPTHNSEFSCTYSSATAHVVNVNEYVNIRQNATLQSPVVAEARLGEQLTLTQPNTWWYLDTTSGERCSQLCQQVTNNSALQPQLTQCIQNAEIWQQVRNSRGQTGYVSVYFLE